MGMVTFSKMETSQIVSPGLKATPPTLRYKLTENASGSPLSIYDLFTPTINQKTPKVTIIVLEYLGIWIGMKIVILSPKFMDTLQQAQQPFQSKSRIMLDSCDKRLPKVV